MKGEKMNKKESNPKPENVKRPEPPPAPPPLNYDKYRMFGGYKIGECEGEGRVENMFCCTKIGNIRDNQEDAVLIMQHPIIDDFKMMVVADGMGGFAKGEIASSLIILEMKKWFEELEEEYYHRSSYLKEDLTKTLERCNKFILHHNRERGYESGSTVVVAITCKEITVVANVGDSRAYIIDNHGITQVTDDDSDVYQLWRSGEIKDKDNIRFHKESNLITQFIGMESGIYVRLSIVKRGIPLLLCSDGISDCLSDYQILLVCTQETPKEEVARTLVRGALLTESTKEGLGRRYNKRILAGKDNATVAFMA
jgi:protein phosphatase